jgi:hypothetical protein
MKRKIIKNRHQYKVNLPIELLRRLNWNESTDIKFHEVSTPLGKGMLIIKNNNKTALKLVVKK